MNPIRVTGWLCAILVAAPGLFPGRAAAQERKRPVRAADKEVRALIDKLTQLDRQDIGYSGSTTGTAFLPLGQRETQTALLFQEPGEASEALCTLVKLGAKALPTLLEHLSDDRPTKIVITHRGGIGGMFIAQDEDKGAKKAPARFGDEKRYIVRVGDLCYVAIGQIVNRGYTAVYYQPTAIILIQSVPRSRKLREELIRKWGKITPERHRDSLIRDLLRSDDEETRNGASLRLGYYYPEALEKAALEQLARPAYPVFAVEALVRNRLYPAKSARERNKLVADFVARHGEIARDGIRWALFSDLESQEAYEEGRRIPKEDPGYRARQCLIDIFGLPATVKSEDKPRTKPLSDGVQARFVQTLLYDRSEKLDHACRDILLKTDDDYLAQGCLDRLVGRGYDREIEAYLKRRLPKLEERERKSLLAYRARLGWTRLHAAVNLGVVELVAQALRDKVLVNVRARDGRTALHLAADVGRADMVELLLRAKANPNIKDEKGRLAVTLAAIRDYAAIVRRLVAARSEVMDGFTAAIVGDTDRLKVFLKDNPHLLKRRNHGGLTLLHVAAREGHRDVVQALIAAGADLKTVDSLVFDSFGELKAVDEPRKEDVVTNGWTALHFAVMAGKTEVAALLLERGADVNAADQRGKLTPLHYAAWGGKADLVKLLLAHKANRNARDEEKRTPLDLAKERGHKDIIKLLTK